MRPAHYRTGINVLPLIFMMALVGATIAIVSPF